jgi:hypothetical protein
MEKFQYVVALAAVITGLGLSDVSVSLHRLLKRRSGVTWDWVPVSLALYLSFILMRLWYQLWSVHAAPFATGLTFTTVQVVQTLILTLVLSAALPDEDDFEDKRVDLRAYYSAHHRYIWRMYLVFLLVWIATAVGIAMYMDRLARLLGPFPLAFFMPPLLFTIIACMTRRRGQEIALIGLIVHVIVITWVTSWLQWQ